MFLGTFEPNLMDRGRLALPKKIRDELGGDRLILTIGFEKCIFGFKEKSWEEVTKSELTRPLFSDRIGRDLRRQMCAQAVNIELDSQGRFIIPGDMLQYAAIAETVTLIGAGDHFEIWSKKTWENYLTELMKRG